MEPSTLFDESLSRHLSIGGVDVVPKLFECVLSEFTERFLILLGAVARSRLVGLTNTSLGRSHQLRGLALHEQCQDVPKCSLTDGYVNPKRSTSLEPMAEADGR